MKKTVKLSSLIKAKSDLELYIKVDQIKRLKKLFDPTFDLLELNSKIEEKEDQLITIKLAIDEGNANKDKDGKTISYSIYRLSKYNREKSDILAELHKLEITDFLSDNEKLKKSLLKDIAEFDDLIKKETDKKKKSDFLISKNKLKRSLTKVSGNSKSHIETTTKLLKARLEEIAMIITQIKSHLTEMNDVTTVEVDISDGFEIVVK